MNSKVKIFVKSVVNFLGILKENCLAYTSLSSIVAFLLSHLNRIDVVKWALVNFDRDCAEKFPETRFVIKSDEYCRPTLSINSAPPVPFGLWVGRYQISSLALPNLTTTS